MTIAIRYAARSDVGLLRQGNEDSLYAGPRLLAVADGMGGHAAGEVASAVAIASIASLDDDVPGSDLLGALERATRSANEQLRLMVEADHALDGMGTTLTAMLVAGSRLGVVHVGDSRAYLLREGELAQITHDHTLVQTLIDEGRLTADEASVHPQRAMIMRALDGGENLQLDLSVREARVGDRYLLCSDGLSGVVSDQSIREALTLAEPQAAVDRLIDLALRGGGPDNITAIVADVVDSDALPVDDVVVAGAAAEHDIQEPPSADTAAGRAALATMARPTASPQDEPSDDLTGTYAVTPSGGGAHARGTHRPLRWLFGLVVVLVVLAAGAWGANAYIRSQYYVGVDAGNVAIYRGVSGSFAGVHLSSVVQRSDVTVTSLPDYERDRVTEGISAGSLSGARGVVARLAGERTATPSASPTPAGSLTPTTSPTKRPTTIPTTARATP